MTTKLSQYQNIMQKYPNKIPIIVNKYDNKDDLPEINKTKFLVEKNMKFTNFVYIIRKRIKLNSEKAIFITINDRLCPSNSTLEEIYNDMKDDDGFLYMKYSSENTFG